MVQPSLPYKARILKIGKMSWLFVHPHLKVSITLHAFFTFAPGGNMEVKDIAISDVVYDGFTFVRSRGGREVVIKSSGTGR